ncbi:MAG: hypothetical protein PF508_02440 [Spirochaeta sp.]|jgi:hypothetical protein|nr:hypothetical protein [Spirochaeta sp.]
MSDADNVCVDIHERDDLYMLLLSQEAHLAPSLEDLKRRLERLLYRNHSIEEMEQLIRRAGNERT